MATTDFGIYDIAAEARNNTAALYSSQIPQYALPNPASHYFFGGKMTSPNQAMGHRASENTRSTSMSNYFHPAFTQSTTYTPLSQETLRRPPPTETPPFAASQYKL